MSKVKRSATAALVSCAVAGCATACQAATPDELQRPGWTLTFHDEFDGSAVDTEKWEVLTRKNSHNEEKQYYLPEQATVVDGVLRITATNEPYEGKNYRSARLESWFTQKYGRFEVRAKIPTTKGIWPAIWLLPREGHWPHNGEIDIMEHGGSRSHDVSCAIHFSDENRQHKHVWAVHQANDENGKPIEWAKDFHIYAAEWSPKDVAFFVDGVEYYRVGHDKIPELNTPMCVILNTAVGGWFDGDPDDNTVFPQFFDIDYVRVYQKEAWKTESDNALE